MKSNTFNKLWCLLKLIIVKFLTNINNEHSQDYSYPGATFAFCSHREKLPGQRGLPGAVQHVTQPLKVALRQRKTHMNSNRHQTVD